MFAYHSVDTVPGTFGVFEDLVAVWQLKRQDAKLPALKDFSAMDLLGWQSNLVISEATPEQNDLWFRFFGDGATKLQGADFTGRYFSEVMPIAYEQLYREHIKKIITEPQIAVGRTPASGDRVKPYFLQVLHLPLSDDGRHVDRILHALLKVEAEEG